MDIDYSQYTPTEYEMYRSIRSNDDLITFDTFSNYAKFNRHDKTVSIDIDNSNEFVFMYRLIEEDGTEEQLKEFVKEHTPTNEDTKVLFEEDAVEKQRRLEYFKTRYSIDRRKAEDDEELFYSDHPDLPHAPFNNVLSGCEVTIPLGEGILDFVYADIDSAFRDTAAIYRLLYELGKEYQKNNPQDQSVTAERTPGTLTNELDLRIRDYYDSMWTVVDTKQISSASLYTAVCPPTFNQKVDPYLALKRYYLYLKALQKEYLEILQFCYDEEYYPEILGNLSPSGRYFTYRMAKGFPTFLKRNEELYMPVSPPQDKKTHEFDMAAFEEFFYREYPEESLQKLADEMRTTTDNIRLSLRFTRALATRYRFSSTAEILELELGKILKNDIRFRKCKRCGRYFIMKGNYDTRYCSRIAEGETRSCQELAAQENYKKKMAENKALPIYSRYYKRYAARVRARQIKEADFKKWKYKALVKRDECSSGRITAEEYMEWLESYFPNRRRKA